MFSLDDLYPHLDLWLEVRKSSMLFDLGVNGSADKPFLVEVTT